MAYVSIGKPGAVTGSEVIESSGTAEIGIAGNVFFIACDRVRLRWFTNSRWVLKDGDRGVVSRETSEVIYMSFNLSGYVVANQEVGVTKLGQQDSSLRTIGFVLSGNEKFPSDGNKDATFVLDDIIVDWDYSAPVIPLAMSGHISQFDLTHAGSELGTT